MRFFQQTVLKLFLFLFYTSSLLGDDWFAYVPTNGSGTVVPINLTTNTLGTPIVLGGFGYSNIAITPDRLTAYVTNNLSGNNVTAIDLTTNTVITPILAGASPLSLAITPNGQTVYVANTGSFDITPIDVATNTPGTPIPLGVGNIPNGIAITPNGQTAYITISNLTNAVVRLDIATNTIVGAPIPIPFPQGIAITPDGTKAFVASNIGNIVTPIDLITNLALPPIPVDVQPFAVAITPNGKTVLVTCLGLIASTVVPIDIATNTAGTPIVLKNPPSLTAPFGIAVTPDSQRAYVSNFGTDEVIPISLVTFTAGTPIPFSLGSAPFGIAITPDQAPTAFFTSTPAPAGSPTQFDASGSTSPVGTITIYFWDYGDGQTETVFSPTTSHIYQTGGQFTVTLTVTNSGGTSTTQTFTGQTVSNNGGPSAVTSQIISIEAPPVVQPFPPSRFIGIVKKNIFLTQSQWILKAKLNASPSPDVVFYRLYHNGELVKVLPAGLPLKFERPLRTKKSAKGFAITAVSSNGLESVPVNIKIRRVCD